MDRKVAKTRKADEWTKYGREKDVRTKYGRDRDVRTKYGRDRDVGTKRVYASQPNCPK